MQAAKTLVIAVALVAAGCAGYVHIDNRPEPKGPPVVVTDSGPAHPAHLGIPPGHLPPPGQCRIWIPGRPPGHQPPTGQCRALRAEVPVGAWLVYRPSNDRQRVEVTVYDLKRPRVVVAVRVYDADSGRLVR